MLNYPVIDMFCGVGGLTHGFLQEGFNVVAGFDIDPSCKYPYEANNKGAKFFNKNIESISAEELIDLYPKGKKKVLVGCAPCQPFSTYTNGQPHHRKKWSLLYVFAQLIREVKPDIVSMENVPRLLHFKKGLVFNDFVSVLKEIGYEVSWEMVYCPDYGIPQQRTRLVLFASRHGKIDLFKKTHSPSDYKTVRDAIDKLPPIKDGQIHSEDPLHKASKLSPLNKKRILHSVPGGTWRDWNEDLLAPCHKKETGKFYTSVYGRMEWDKPSPTITTQCYGYGNGRFGHPVQNRAISLREAALLQTFPGDYRFVSPKDQIYFKVAARHIGNAVPVKLGQVIAKSIKKHLEATGD